MEDPQGQANNIDTLTHALFENISTDDPEVLRVIHRVITGENVDEIEGLVNAVYLAAFRDVLEAIKEIPGQTYHMINTSEKKALRNLAEYIRRETIYEIISMLDGESEKKLKRLDVRDNDIVRTDSPLIVKHKHLESQIDQLSNCVLKHFADEIGLGDPVRGEGACAVAVRLLERYAGSLTENKEAGA